MCGRWGQGRTDDGPNHVVSRRPELEVDAVEVALEVPVCALGRDVEQVLVGRVERTTVAFQSAAGQGGKGQGQGKGGGTDELLLPAGLVGRDDVLGDALGVALDRVWQVGLRELLDPGRKRTHSGQPAALGRSGRAGGAGRKAHLLGRPRLSVEVALLDLDRPALEPRSARPSAHLDTARVEERGTTHPSDVGSLSSPARRRRSASSRSLRDWEASASDMLLLLLLAAAAGVEEEGGGADFCWAGDTAEGLGDAGKEGESGGRGVGSRLAGWDGGREERRVGRFRALQAQATDEANGDDDTRLPYSALCTCQSWPGQQVERLQETLRAEDARREREGQRSAGHAARGTRSRACDTFRPTLAPSSPARCPPLQTEKRRRLSSTSGPPVH